CLQTLEFPWTF
nr:immunoglobulin light chain junction region [Macaca mulatta]MOW51614.1 immunoglobulin light chain junction region [Macaca mulatta]MOW51636.1 immunoglobulin light chain junction region [Macaca mulatta]MOW52005.1 immunoglobulin light chain junction region [Macaca mulatta]MOW52062.1 immunoglobulin light chain junction region [Macaca mulatta]